MNGLKEIPNRLKIERFNPMQEVPIEAFSKGGEDLISFSSIGSGKTLVFLLPLIGSLRTDVKGVQAMVLVLSRELALRTEQAFKVVGTGFKAMSCYGGRLAMGEHRTMKGVQPEVITGTSGRMNNHLSKQNFDASTVSLLVIGEFDKCLGFGFQEEMVTVIGQLPDLKRRFLTSATDAEEIPQFTGPNRMMKLDFLIDDVEESCLRLMKVVSPAKDKIETLYKLLCTLGSSSSIVFCNHRDAVDRVSALLMEKGVPNGRSYGGMEQSDRERALYKFCSGSCPVLVSTDLAARGLDIPEVEHITHYHIPVNEEAFTHRSGHTARWDAMGTSYLILNPEERMPDHIPSELNISDLPRNAPRPSKPQWITIYIGKGKKSKLSKIDIAGFLYKKGNLAREDARAIDVKDHYASVAVRRSKAKQLLTLIRDEKIKGMKTVIEEAD